MSDVQQANVAGELQLLHGPAVRAAGGKGGKDSPLAYTHPLLGKGPKKSSKSVVFDQTGEGGVD